MSHADIEELGYFMCCPKGISADIFLNVMRPILLNDATMIIPKVFTKGIFNSKIQHEDLLKSVAVSAHQAMQGKDVGAQFLRSSVPD